MAIIDRAKLASLYESNNSKLADVFIASQLYLQPLRKSLAFIRFLPAICNSIISSHSVVVATYILLWSVLIEPGFSVVSSPVNRVL